MPLDNPPSGFGLVGEYQVSGLPWITSSVLAAGEMKEYRFDYVSKWILVKNLTGGSTVNVGVTPNGVQKTGNYFTLLGGESAQLDWRCARLYVSASLGTPGVSVIAGLTGISTRHSGLVSALTSSNQWNGVG